MFLARRLRLVGRRLRAARISLGLDEDGFAHELGLSLDVYLDIEQGETEPDLETLVLIAWITGKSVDFLLTGRSSDAAD